MPVFEYYIVNPQTGRRKKRSKRAYDHEHLAEVLLADGVVPLDVKARPDEPATEAQLNLMRDRMIKIPDGVTKNEASDLISNFFERRTVCTPQDIEIAKKMRLEVSQYASKHSIYYGVLIYLRTQGDMQKLGAWYAYRVYRSACDRSRADVISDPLDVRFFDIGSLIAADTKLVTSLKRISSGSTVYFRWFGTFKTPDGTLLHGEGIYSEVYKYVMAQLQTRGMIESQQTRSINEMPIPAPQARVVTSNAGRPSNHRDRMRPVPVRVGRTEGKPKRSKLWVALEVIGVAIGIYLVGKWLLS